MRGTDDPGVRKQAIENITQELIRCAKNLQRLGESHQDIMAFIRRALEDGKSSSVTEAIDIALNRRTTLDREEMWQRLIDMVVGQHTSAAILDWLWEEDPRGEHRAWLIDQLKNQRRVPEMNYEVEDAVLRQLIADSPSSTA